MKNSWSRSELNQFKNGVNVGRFAQLRQWVNRHSAFMTILAVLFLTVSVGVIISIEKGVLGRSQGTDVWYYDTSAEHLFAAKSNDPTVMNSGAGAAVRAYVFGCKGCSGDQRFIGYLEKIVPDDRGAVSQAAVSSGGQLRVMIRSVKSDYWVDRQSAEGIEVLRQINTHCPDKKDLVPCRPGDK